MTLVKYTTRSPFTSGRQSEHREQRVSMGWIRSGGVEVAIRWSAGGSCELGSGDGRRGICGRCNIGLFDEPSYDKPTRVDSGKIPSFQKRNRRRLSP
ncbi:hypothetical protein PILCRDRAFT_828192 [Piloderma croceum F 1598]|uniref:Uncharacterized protein n=1 Tax=Piloderma croceum (strain F 1598) TaxID=765440 RepID=A0A0C3BAY0_PILCF|nr:hypothetical protein PILCRDRAFT_828192 [Piloderma croceum F 1598]